MYTKSNTMPLVPYLQYQTVSKCIPSLECEGTAGHLLNLTDGLSDERQDLLELLFATKNICCQGSDPGRRPIRRQSVCKSIRDD